MIYFDYSLFAEKFCNKVLAQLWRSCGNDCFVLEHLFYGRGRIKTHHRAQKFIAELFREQGRIKTKHRQQTFIAELFRGRGQNMFNGGRQIITHYNGTKRRRERGYI